MSVKNMNYKELKDEAAKIRQRILEVVSKNGGHLTSSLGAVEIILAIHKIFDPSKDPIIFDVSHQAYAHKLLTGRFDSFESLRTFGGISGYTKPSESPYDYFIAGHSSTSISLAVGAAKAIALRGEDRLPVVVIGDGALTAGMVYEAMNELGDAKYPMVIIINDNEMSIAKPIGAISNYLSRRMAGDLFQSLKRRTEKLLKGYESIEYLAKRVEESFKLITPGLLFEELGLNYIGPVDGHNIQELCDVLETAKNFKKPVVVHTQTTKGKGYDIAEGKNEKWHGVGPFDIRTGAFSGRAGGAPAPTAVFSAALLDLAAENERVVGVTAAMPSGTGLGALIERYPQRFWDVAIAEQHAVTSCAAMAKEGLIPFCVIYSTFLQRAFDQIIHDVAILGAPVVFAIDRAGIVGEDGETHQGLFDIAYLNVIPHIVLFAPRDNATLKDAVRFAASLGKPCAFRYPRSSFSAHTEIPAPPFELGKAQFLKDPSKEACIVAYGNGAAKALAVWEILRAQGINVGVLDLRFLKPLDTQALKAAADQSQKLFVISDSAKGGGVESIVLACLNSLGLKNSVFSFEIDDFFVKHGKVSEIEKSLGLDAQSIADTIKKQLNA